MKIQAAWKYFIVLLTVTAVKAQDLEVRNVRFEDKGETVTVMYDLQGNPKKKYEVSVALSHDQGKSFTIHPQHLSGDVGRNVKPGENKEIVWKLEDDYPFGLVGDAFVFAVTAQTQKSRISRLPYYILGAGLAGGIVYYATRKSPRENTTMNIRIPADF
jgi:hypothetical protein